MEIVIFVRKFNCLMYQCLYGMVGCLIGVRKLSWVLVSNKYSVMEELEMVSLYVRFDGTMNRACVVRLVAEKCRTGNLAIILSFCISCLSVF